MSIVDIIKRLSIHIAPKWEKHMGDNANASKQKVKENNGYVAGRDVNIHNHQMEKDELPYVYLKATFGGNGPYLRLMNCRTYNLSDVFIFVKKMEIFGRTIPFDDMLVKVGDNITHTGIDDLEYPTSNTPQSLKITYFSRNKEFFVASQALSFSPRGDGKFDVALSEVADISRLGEAI